MGELPNSAPAQQRAIEVIGALLSCPYYLSADSFIVTLRTLVEFAKPPRPSTLAIAAMRGIKIGIIHKKFSLSFQEIDRMFSMVLGFLGLSVDEEAQGFSSPIEPSSQVSQIPNIE